MNRELLLDAARALDYMDDIAIGEERLMKVSKLQMLQSLN
jgi:hypothetical protein